MTNVCNDNHYHVNIVCYNAAILHTPAHVHATTQPPTPRSSGEARGGGGLRGLEHPLRSLGSINT